MLKRRLRNQKVFLPLNLRSFYLCCYFFSVVPSISASSSLSII